MSSFNAPTCQHTKTNGTKCASPALKDKQFCFFHERCRTLKMEFGRGYSNYARRPLILPVFEDAHSIQLSSVR
jgi:hypothetical protein